MSDDLPRESKPFEEAIEKLISRLRRATLPANVFNLYHATDTNHDVRGGSAKRRENLRRYLKAIQSPKFVLVGLCPGYRGARFTGVPFSDEARLCIAGSCYDRSSLRPEPWRERSAGVVLDMIGARTDVVCFNAVPWHVHEPGNPLSNAQPNAEVVALGLAELDYFLGRLYPNAQPVSVGEVARDALAKVGATHGPPMQKRQQPLHIRHPAHGGEKEFRDGMRTLLGIPSEEETD